MYTVQIQKSVTKFILKVDRPTAKRLRDAIDAISKDPTLGVPLTNHTAQYKYRVGKFRILYDVFESELIIEIIKVASRGDVYND